MVLCLNLLLYLELQVEEFNVADVAADVERAIDKQASGSGDSVFDMLQISAPNSSQYWLYVANELHRREMFYEQLDCWREGEKHLDSNDFDFWYQDKISTLINAYEQTDDKYFGELALAAADKLIETNESSALNAKLMLIQLLKPNRDVVLELIEHILDKDYSVEVELDCKKFGINPGYELDKIHGYSDLAECYLWIGDISEAIRIWAKAVKNDTTDEALCSAIFWLVNHVDSKKIEPIKYLPEEFGKFE